MVNTNPLIAEPPDEVPLMDAPLVRVIAQVIFPPILSIEKKDFVGSFQEAIRDRYPVLHPQQYEEVKQIIGAGNSPQKPTLSPLSQDAIIARKPPNPADLVEALQDPIHHDIGRARPAKAVRSRSNKSEG